MKLLLACRLDSHRDRDDQDATLTEFIDRIRLQWHGVKLNEPDWGEHSHSLAATAWAPHLGATLHWMVNAYWEPLIFELPPVPAGCPGSWCRWVDTSFDSPADISDWRRGSPTTTASYNVQPRSLVILVLHDAQSADSGSGGRPDYW